MFEVILVLIVMVCGFIGGTYLLIKSLKNGYFKYDGDGEWKGETIANRMIYLIELFILITGIFTIILCFVLSIKILMLMF